jgi:hypothetical protein
MATTPFAAATIFMMQIIITTLPAPAAWVGGHQQPGWQASITTTFGKGQQVVSSSTVETRLAVLPVLPLLLLLLLELAWPQHHCLQCLKAAARGRALSRRLTAQPATSEAPLQPVR